MVAFTAVLGRDWNNIPAYQTIVFDHVVTNYGNSYNPANGMFTAPSQGLYLFTWNLFTVDGGGIGTELTQNGNPRIESFLRGTGPTQYNAHGSGILDLAAGDKVYLRCDEAHGKLNALKTTFTGMKIM